MESGVGNGRILWAQRLRFALLLVRAIRSTPGHISWNRPIRLVAPFAAAGGADVSARLFGQKLAEAFNQQVVIDNRPGAGGIVGAALVVKATPDGYTLMLASIAHTALPALHKNLPYDIVKDFTPVTMLVSFSHLLLVHPSVAAKSVKELVALAKAKPGQLSYSSGGYSSSAHLTRNCLEMSGTNIVHVPYNGAGPAVIGFVAGETSMGFWSVSASGQLVKAGRLRALASSGESRMASFPELPPSLKRGFRDTKRGHSQACLPLPAPLNRSLPSFTERLVRILQIPEVKERLATLDFEPVGNTPEEFAVTIKKEVVKWAKVVRSLAQKSIRCPLQALLLALTFERKSLPGDHAAERSHTSTACCSYGTPPVLIIVSCRETT